MSRALFFDDELVWMSKKTFGYAVTKYITFFCSQKPTAFDILTYVFLDNSVKKQKDCLDEFPKIKAIVGAIAARPAIAKWIAERPQTEN